MDEDKIYDTIVVGSGNGACGFLNYYLQATANRAIPKRVLVVEEGDSFFETSDISHQNHWTQSYGEGNIFKLHNALNFDGIPILSGRACTMGGGGSINYTMIHESSEWLSKHIGKTATYWDELKAELNAKFRSLDLPLDRSPVTKHVLQVAQKAGFQCSTEVCGTDKIRKVPNYPEGDAKLLHIFPTQFDQFGQRTYSGVSLVDWFDKQVELKTRCKVVQLEFSDDCGEGARCVGVYVRNLDTGNTERVSLEANDGKLILCAGAATPRLLLPHQKKLQNDEIGKQVSDHICMPLGIYLLDKNIKVTSRDSYVPVFATTVSQPEQERWATVCCFDFFAGEFKELWFFISHLYLTFLLPNWFKKVMIKIPTLFWLTKNVVRMLILWVNLIIDFCWGLHNLSRGNVWHNKLNLVTAIVKFNPAVDGYYTSDGTRIALGFFSEGEDSNSNQDKEIAKNAITNQLDFISCLGEKPNWIFKSLFRLFTKIPYEKNQVERYVDIYSKKFLLSEQHLSGGCLFGKAIDPGIDNPANTGKLYGSANAYVADLSSVPLPRISPQMTAYLIGFHVAKMLCTDNN
ncbi:choline dehydrogenase [Scytonema sp. UIC 10036]|uniref:GMC family oxidoreductase N-terminal domain-containing protein n=1 Tax=Scytonema sp. UIC 10036 TaxID=2304196 RepID=UPI0012DA8B16|nr:GMC family oxidoreductase N-terminal domain-containing protein [Scytonema sp. UIC 10036]MUG92079.1 choline dehydrogenase [Scytonema sp. UIC 10036]